MSNFVAVPLREQIFQEIFFVACDEFSWTELAAHLGMDPRSASNLAKVQSGKIDMTQALAAPLQRLVGQWIRPARLLNLFGERWHPKVLPVLEAEYAKAIIAKGLVIDWETPMPKTPTVTGMALLSAICKAVGVYDLPSLAQKLGQQSIANLTRVQNDDMPVPTAWLIPLQKLCGGRVLPELIACKAKPDEALRFYPLMRYIADQAPVKPVIDPRAAVKERTKAIEARRDEGRRINREARNDALSATRAAAAAERKAKAVVPSPGPTPRPPQAFKFRSKKRREPLPTLPGQAMLVVAEQPEMVHGFASIAAFFDLIEMELGSYSRGVKHFSEAELHRLLKFCVKLPVRVAILFAPKAERKYLLEKFLKEFRGRPRDNEAPKVDDDDEVPPEDFVDDDDY